MKKFLSLLFSCIVVLSLANKAYATEGFLIAPNPMIVIAPNPVTTEPAIMVQNDGGYIDFADENGFVVEPQIINGRTMVPFRKIFNSLGVTNEDIEWIAEERKVIAKKDDVTIELQIDNNLAKKVVGEEITEITLDTAPTIIDGRTMVPVRFIAESMNKNVSWDASNRTVIIIDTASLIQKFKEAMPKYFEIANLQTTTLESFELPTNFNIDLEYADSDDKSNNTKIKVNGTVKFSKSEDAILVNVELTVKGSGILYETIKDEELDKISITAIVTEGEIYLKSSLFDNKNEWLKFESEYFNEIFKALNGTYQNPTDAFELALNNVPVDVETYSIFERALEICKDIYNVMDINVSGTSTIKYTIDVDLLDVLDVLDKYAPTIDAKTLRKFIKLAKISASATIKDGVAQVAKEKLTFKLVEDSETLNMTFNVEAKMTSYNKKVNITIPEKSNVYNTINLDTI